MAEEIAFENDWISNFEGLVTLTFRSYCSPSCITHRPLPTCQISLKSKKRFVDGQTYARTYTQTFETGFIMSTLSKIRPKKTKNHARVTFHHLPGRPHWGDWFEFWHAGSYCRCNHPLQILWQSVHGFRSSPNFAILHRNSWSPLLQCKHYSATRWSHWNCKEMSY